MNRRNFIKIPGGVVAAGTIPVTAQKENNSTSGSGNSSKGNKSNTNKSAGNQTSGKKASGGTTKTVKVGTKGNGGYYAFSPAELTVQPGTTVKWVWTGKGGAHNVVASDGSFKSGAPESGSSITFSHTFEKKGSFEYHCVPHQSLGMKGTITVGSASGGGVEAEADPEEMGVPFQAHYVGIATILMVLMSLLYTFFFLKYGESAHTSSGN